MKMESVLSFLFVLSVVTASGLDCASECSTRIAISTNAVEYTGKNSCARGCRFYTLTQLILEAEPSNSLKIESCRKMCAESYGESTLDLASCQLGCQVASSRTAEVSWMWFIEGPNSLQIFQSDLPSEPDEILTDFSLRSQIESSDGRLPEMRLRTLPVAEEAKESPLCGGGALRGLPYCLIWSVLLLMTLVGLWSCLSFDDSPTQDLKKILLIPDEELPEKLPLTA